MSKLFLRLWWVLTLRGAVALAFGVITLVWPGLTLLALVALFVVYALASGIAAVTGAVMHRNTDEDWWLTLLIGLAGIAAGIIAAVHPTLTAIVLVLVMGAFALASGILDCAVAIRLRKLVRNEWLLLFAGVISILFGVLVFTNPLAGMLALVTLFSLYLIVFGASLLTLGLRMRIWSRKGEYPGAGTERRVTHERRISVRSS